LETSEGKKDKSNRMRAAAAIRYRPTIDNGSNIAKCHINLAIAIHNCGRSSGGIEYRCCRPHTFSRFLLNLPWRLNFNSCFDSTWLAHFLYTLTPRFFFRWNEARRTEIVCHRQNPPSASLFKFFFSATTTAENSREKWRTDRQKKEKMNCVERDSSRRGASSLSLIIGPQSLGEEENKKGKNKIIKRDKT
jgi:hypothetical protein